VGDIQVMGAWGRSQIIVYPSQVLYRHREAKREAVPSPKTAPNIGLQATANSLRSFFASAIGGA